MFLCFCVCVLQLQIVYPMMSQSLIFHSSCHCILVLIIITLMSAILISLEFLRTRYLFALSSTHHHKTFVAFINLWHVGSFSCFWKSIANLLNGWALSLSLSSFLGLVSGSFVLWYILQHGLCVRCFPLENFDTKLNLWHLMILRCGFQNLLAWSEARKWKLEVCIPIIIKATMQIYLMDGQALSSFLNVISGGFVCDTSCCMDYAWHFSLGNFNTKLNLQHLVVLRGRFRLPLPNMKAGSQKQEVCIPIFMRQQLAVSYYSLIVQWRRIVPHSWMRSESPKVDRFCI